MLINKQYIQIELKIEKYGRLAAPQLSCIRPDRKQHMH